MKQSFLSPRAKQDLREIDLYVSTLSRDASARIIRHIWNTLADLSAHPLLGRTEETFTRILGVPIRSMLAGSYRIVYEVGADSVQVVAVLHGARDLEAVLQQRVQ